MVWDAIAPIMTSLQRYPISKQAHPTLYLSGLVCARHTCFAIAATRNNIAPNGVRPSIFTYLASNVIIALNISNTFPLIGRYHSKWSTSWHFVSKLKFTGNCRDIFIFSYVKCLSTHLWSCAVTYDKYITFSKSHVAEYHIYITTRECQVAAMKE